MNRPHFRTILLAVAAFLWLTLAASAYFILGYAAANEMLYTWAAGLLELQTAAVLG